LGLRVVEPRGLGGAWSVAALLQAVSDALAARLSACRVQGEISAWTLAASGHCYFTLKDSSGAAASVRCVMFRRSASLLTMRPQDGYLVQVLGRMTVYEPRGDMQLVVEAMQPLGAGALYEQFLRLKAKLEAEGLFDESRKRALPRFAQSVGVVTSLAGAALHDVLSTLARRAPQVRVVVYPSLVQGAEAPAALLRALALAAARCEVDVLIVARGGGAIEDLWAFNDEQVVRAVAAMPMPVVAGVGHETDVTLIDFVADLRAPTPTAAAEMAAPARDELQSQLDACALAMRRRVHQTLERESQRLDQRGLALARPARWWQREAQRVQALSNQLRQTMTERLRGAREAPQRAAERLRHAAAIERMRARSRLDGWATRLEATDPTRVLARGYALMQTDDGAVVRRPAQLHAGQILRVTLAEGASAIELASAKPLAAP
jgi:exodeoxyribonuclease VII large subunit